MTDRTSKLTVVREKMLSCYLPAATYNLLQGAKRIEGRTLKEMVIRAIHAAYGKYQKART